MRNIAIIAHVDHGKTTLVDGLLRQSGTFRDNQKVADCVMDSNDLERERGITILSKCTSVEWHGTHINIVDTPGHADFGGEVERILSMVDGVLLLVDASEGPMPQTKFVLGKALKQGLRPIVVINKIDKPDQRAKEVVEEIFDLFVNLEATDEQLDFPILYASGRDGWASEDVEKRGGDLKPLLDKIVDFVPCPKSKYEDDEFRFLATMLEQDNFLGRVLTGKIYSGKAKVNQQIQVLDLQNKVVEKCKITRIQKFVGLTRETVEEADAGEIVTIAGCSIGTVSNTLCSANVKECVPSTPIDPPTLSMTIGPNTSPLAGKSGKKLTSNMIKDRLEKEAENNIAITIKPSQEKDSYEVGGRGELQLGVLIETMRREGFELSVARPKVVIHTDENGNKQFYIPCVIFVRNGTVSDTHVSTLDEDDLETEFTDEQKGKLKQIYYSGFIRAGL
jgi:GTP-binding protein